MSNSVNDPTAAAVVKVITEGPQGPAGPAGAPGSPGAGLSFQGSVATIGDLPTSATTGHGYIVEATGDLYLWNGSTWVNAGPIQGPPGATGPAGPAGNPGSSAYQIAVAAGFTGTESQWLASLVGPQGATGPAGQPGVDGSPGADGADGLSAYQLAVAAGFTGTQAEWLASLIGPQGPAGPAGPAGADGAPGPAGPQGEQGPQGIQGETGPAGADGSGLALQGTVPTVGDLPGSSTVGYGYIVELTGDLYIWNGTGWVNAGPIQGPAGPAGPAGPTGATGPAGADGAPGADGTDGSSAYQLALAAGFTGTESEWLASLVGPQGPAGPTGSQGPAGADGSDGAPGADGASAYQLAVAGGFSGTEAQWLASLVGPQGPAGPTGPAGADGLDGSPGADGADGSSAYEIAVAGGFVGSEAAWLASLVGPQGPTGPAGPQGDQGPTGATGPAGPQGPAGPTGATGPQGPAGVGVPAGGTTGQYLRKTSGTDYDASWSDLPATDLSYDPATRQLASSTGTDVTLPLFSSTEAGLTPLSGGGTTNFLRADGTWAAPPGGSGITDGDKGDITVSASGTVWSIDAGVVSTTELGGDITTAGKALLDDADAAAQRTTLGLGTAATQDVGTSAGNVVQLDGSARLPAVDGSQLINLPSGGGGGLTHFVESEGTASPNDTTPVDALTATDAGYTDIDVALVAKGTGATLAQVPDGTAAGGDKRGQYATDLQKARGANTQVASGDYSAILGGSSNTASSSYSFVVGGQSNTAQTSSHAAVCGGRSNNASGQYSFIGGGQSNVASGFRAGIGGGLLNTNTTGGAGFIGGGSYNTVDSVNGFIGAGTRGITRGIENYHVVASNNFGNTGQSQSGKVVLGRETTDATPAPLTTNTAPFLNASSQVNLPNNSAYSFTGEIIAGVTGGGDTARWEIKGAIKRGANAASTTMVGSPTVTMTHNDAGAASWTVDVTANTTLGGIKVEVTGAAATTIRWVCKLETTEMTY